MSNAKPASRLLKLNSQAPGIGINFTPSLAIEGGQSIRFIFSHTYGLKDKYG